jgi:hypothetical protein
MQKTLTRNESGILPTPMDPILILASPLKKEDNYDTGDKNSVAGDNSNELLTTQLNEELEEIVKSNKVTL